MRSNWTNWSSEWIKWKKKLTLHIDIDITSISLLFQSEMYLLYQINNIEIHSYKNVNSSFYSKIEIRSSYTNWILRIIKLLTSRRTIFPFNWMGFFFFFVKTLFFRSGSIYVCCYFFCIKKKKQNVPNYKNNYLLLLLITFSKF